ncbi:hypothetical protein VK792_18640 [Mesobacterium sp. TK19101]|uniref:Uncharacterized protein n=1 Tax=Mesobacterium hydrothermale TaxID=3111907 RepID=A0ABU6HLX4_9RHOB|nr:hypothetical protein [Mesobacterium sp. TK19101]MEC3863311.1 hypothetical protein [Mesobacterium sp. TK19101]
MQITRTRPDTLPVDEAAFLEGMHLMQGEDPELESDAYRKVRAAALEFEEHGQLALINQTVRCTMYQAPLGTGIRLPIGPVQDGAQITVSVVAADGQEYPLTAAQLTFWRGPRPMLFITDDGALPPEIREAHAGLKIEYQAGFGPDHTAVPDDIAQAIISQAALMQDAGWDLRRGHNGLSPHTARIAARYRGVAV